MNWTKEQSQAIVKKDSNILVAAAAGSGKTAVLVERIIRKIVEEKVDIDRLLIVTFTNAAASQMREKILDAIYEKLESSPEDSHLQRQLLLINKANICTIHSFCLNVIKNNFFEIGISSNFKIGDTTQLEILKQEVVDNLFEEKYLNEDKEFKLLTDSYASYRGDDELRDIVFKIYTFIQSEPFPEEWLDKMVERFNLLSKTDIDFSETIWGQEILSNFKEEVLGYITELEILKEKLEKEPDLAKYYNLILNDIENLKEVHKSSGSWDDARKVCINTNFENWPQDRKVLLELKDVAKNIRKKIRDSFSKSAEDIELYTSKEALDDIYSMHKIMRALKDLVLEFSKLYKEAKKEKNIIDFNDIEHFALNILVKKEKDEYVLQDAAKKYRENFVEIAIDEYQDSNLIQECILSCLSKNNLFMVGDIKQSIYKFRGAVPELFLNKYKEYVDIEENKKEVLGKKIKLFKNFRSRQNILGLTNLVFQGIMSEKLGDIDYNVDEFLNLGADYIAPQEEINCAGKNELCIIDIKEQKEDIVNTGEESISTRADMESAPTGKI